MRCHMRETAGTLRGLCQHRAKSLHQGLTPTAWRVAGVATSLSRRVRPQCARRGYAPRSAALRYQPAPSARYAACPEGHATPTRLVQLPQAVQRQIEAFADADSRSAHQAEDIRRQIIDSPQFLLQELILLQRKRSGQITRLRRKIFATDEVRLEGMAVGRQTIQQTPETKEIVEAGCVAQRRLLLAQPTEPAEKMRISAQFRKAVNLWEGRPEIGEEAAPNVSIFSHGIRPQAEAKSLDMRFEDLFEARLG